MAIPAQTNFSFSEIWPWTGVLLLRKRGRLHLGLPFHRKLFSGTVSDEIKLGPGSHRGERAKWLSVPGVLRISQSYLNHGDDVIGVCGEPPCERNSVRIPQSH